MIPLELASDNVFCTVAAPVSSAIGTAAVMANDMAPTANAIAAKLSGFAAMYSNTADPVLSIIKTTRKNFVEWRRQDAQQERFELLLLLR